METKRIPLLANLVLAVFTLIGAVYCTFPWCDELVLAPFRSQDRKTIFRKGLASAIAFAVSYAFMVLWYFLHGETRKR